MLCVAKALYDFDAAEEDELGFLAGDQINVIMKVILMKLSPFAGFFYIFTRDNYVRVYHSSMQ